ncbi:fructokinase [Parabacteroides sp. PF5-5]|uniref:carbohydrate kinase family protein n=1 Tax=unclassified Parabacteroides TaxID=2649774 RepID=UPI002473D43E|nr:MULTISPECIES: carbohydrate kinase [unclassified Parabacteroides]MDH6306769.1 fructokinase [Parabacteroides sp. PH5-39]MDH6317655.1 fructokinase [Parabacteroides sp. PF5-13]MDH6321481.1 fructokinase [Parabacteroides sp. PH5-13]MDH6325242.1 fructokinase [Parabacteroides sp. PH5-8]MDH6328840.1 fructokinase [Parabacteroides sp. PH5-41]
MNPTVVGIGELLWDVFPNEKKAGGAPINFVYHASQLGSEGYAISAVGNDVFGTEILQVLEKNHIRHCIETVEHPTGNVLVELDNKGKPTYTIVEGVAWDYIPLTQGAIDLVKRADAVCFGTLAQRATVSRETITALLNYAPAASLRFFDINIRQHFYTKELIEACLQKANVFKINDEELELICQMFDLKGSTDEICRLFIEKYALRYMILTAGSDFSTIYTASEQSTIQTPKVTVADTVGAGDAFSGAFVHSILNGKPLREAHQTAVDIAAYVCTKQGAWPPYPNK